MKVIYAPLGRRFFIIDMRPEGTGYVEVQATNGGSLQIATSATIYTGENKTWLTGYLKPRYLRRSFENADEELAALLRWRENPRLFFEENPDALTSDP